MARPSSEDYTVGWVCALPVELAAAQEMLEPVYRPNDIAFRSSEEDSA
jgi:hypothetical protein